MYSFFSGTPGCLLFIASDNITMFVISGQILFRSALAKTIIVSRHWFYCFTFKLHRFQFSFCDAKPRHIFGAFAGNVKTNENVLTLCCQIHNSYKWKPCSDYFKVHKCNIHEYNLSYHQGCISCINYPSNKLSFIRWVLNKPCTHNSLGQRHVAVSCVIFRGFHSLFCPICLIC